MKKFLVILLMMVMFTFVAIAEEDGPAWVCTYVNNSSGIYATTQVSDTNIYLGKDRIIGFSIVPCDPTKHSELLAALYDTTSTVPGPSAEIIAESEAGTQAGSTVWFPYPRAVDNGLLVRQGPNTTVIIYFVR